MPFKRGFSLVIEIREGLLKKAVMGLRLIISKVNSLKKKSGEIFREWGNNGKEVCIRGNKLS